MIIRDYRIYLKEAKRWASIAIANKRAGVPWHAAAKNSHEYLSFALLVIA